MKTILFILSLSISPLIQDTTNTTLLDTTNTISEKVKSFWELPFAVPIISLISGIIGALIGGYMQRKTQRQTWLLERRTQIFAEFIKILDNCKKEASMAMNDISRSEQEIIYAQINLNFAIARDNLYIVRLFLPKKEVSALENLFEEYVKSIADFEFGLRSDSKNADFFALTNKREQIQNILERNIRKI